MKSPFAGSKTPGAGYKDPAYPSHLGLDIRPTKRGTAGNPVAAMFSGEVWAVRRNAVPGGKTSTPSAPGRTGNYVLIKNVGPHSSGDGEYQLYNHVSPVGGLRVGDAVDEGHIIGHNDRSGNQSAPHLHLETWDKNRQTYNPELAFKAHNIKVGAALAPAKKFHVVKSGEYLGLIAVKNLTTVAKIMKLNPTIKDKNLISVGMKLRVK